MKITITLEIKGQKIELSLIEAQQLANQLANLLPGKEVISYPVIYPNYPVYPYPVTVTYSDTNGKRGQWQQQISGDIAIY